MLNHDRQFGITAVHAKEWTLKSTQDNPSCYWKPPLGVTPPKPLLISKTSRHDEADHNTDFHVSHSTTEQAVIAALPLNVKHVSCRGEKWQWVGTVAAGRHVHLLWRGD